MRVKVLVTGASGFVGTRLIPRLVAEGFAVRATYRATGVTPMPGVERWTLPGLDDEQRLGQAVEGCDAIIHLAALAHQRASAEDRLPEYLRVNAQGTARLARAAARAGAHRFVFVSSIAAICTRSEAAVDEQTLNTPIDPYGRSKLEGERALISELKDSATDWCILRPPLVYGPANPGNMQRLLRLIGTRWPLPLGSIRNRRSFVFIDNLTDALVAVLRHPRPIRSTFVLSDGTDLSTPELIRALAEGAGLHVSLWPLPVALLRLIGWAGDAARMLFGQSPGLYSTSIDRLIGSLPVNGSRFNAVFAWQPPVSAGEALRRTGQSLSRPPAPGAALSGR